jgi:hypothetical protein
MANGILKPEVEITHPPTPYPPQPTREDTPPMFHVKQSNSIFLEVPFCLAPIQSLTRAGLKYFGIGAR